MSGLALKPDAITLEQLLASELEEARIIQRAMVNAERARHDRLEVAVLFRPAREVGGDFLDHFTLSDGTFAFYMGDVVGKGLAAAMYAALAVGTLRGINKAATRPDNVLALLNERLRMRVVPGRFCCAFYATFERRTRQLTFSNAAMPRPILISASGCQEVGDGGLPAGMFEGAHYDSHELALSPGEAVLFSTDGLIEAQNEAGDQFGLERMLEVCTANRSAPLDELLACIMEAVDAHTSDVTPNDDMTALLLRAR
jgi:serine phosphatase RsbU (regulator of sigma subunit)